MEALSPPVDGDRNRASTMLAVTWAPFPIIVSFIFLRLYVRVSIRSLGIDDYLMFIAWILETGLSISSTFSVANGGGRHIYYFTSDQVETFLKYLPINQAFLIMACAFGKASVGFLMLRIIGPNTIWRKWCIYINVGLYMTFSIVDCVIGFVQCNPVRALWQHIPTAKCWDPKIYVDVSILLASHGVFVDLFLAFLPITIVWNLKMNIKKKSDFVLFLVQATGVCAAIKTAQIPDFAAKTDITWAIYSAYIWGSLEITLVQICGCIPTLKPLYDYFTSGKPMTPRNRPLRPTKDSYQTPSQTTGHSGRTASSLDTMDNPTNNVIISGGGPQWATDNYELGGTGAGAKTINVKQRIDVDLEERVLLRR